MSRLLWQAELKFKEKQAKSHLTSDLRVITIAIWHYGVIKLLNKKIKNILLLYKQRIER